MRKNAKRISLKKVMFLSKRMTKTGGLRVGGVGRDRRYCYIGLGEEGERAGLRCEQSCPYRRWTSMVSFLFFFFFIFSCLCWGGVRVV